MGFINSSCSFSRFRILETVDKELLSQIENLLKQHAFHDIDDLPENQSFGWVCFDDMLDPAWETSGPQKGQYLVFSLRLDTRRVPPGVIKKHVAIALKNEKIKNGASGQKFISRERKKELKELVISQLQKRFLPIPGEFNLAWSLTDNEVWFASTQGKMIDLVMELFLNTFNLHLLQLTPYNLASCLLNEKDLDKLDEIESSNFIYNDSRECSMEEIGQSTDTILGEEFLTWLWYLSEVEPSSFTLEDGTPFALFMEQRIVVQAGHGQNRETASVSGPSPLREARFGVATGKKVCRACIRLEKDGNTWQFALKADDFSLSSLKTPKIDHKENDDPDATLLEKIFLLEECLKMLDFIYKKFLGLRLSPSHWPHELNAMSNWLSRKE